MTLQLPDIAFIGKAGAGKTSAAKTLSIVFGYEHLSLATPLKRVAVSLWGPDAVIDRDKLQRLGLAIRAIHENTFVDISKRIIHERREQAASQSLLLPPARFVIDDVRFPNEYWALKEAGFRFVRIEADRNRRVARLQADSKLSDEAQLDHVSETSLDHHECDALIGNDATPDDFGVVIAKLVRIWSA